MVLPRDEIRASRGCPSLWTLDPVGRASLGGACGGGDGELSRECGCAGLKVAMRAVVPPRVWPQRAAEASPRSRSGGGSGPLCRLCVDSDAPQVLCLGVASRSIHSIAVTVCLAFEK